MKYRFDLSLIFSVLFLIGFLTISNYKLVTKLIVGLILISILLSSFILNIFNTNGSLVGIPGTFWFGRFDGMKKMDQIEEPNVGIALATARLDNEEMVHFLPQKSAKIKRAG